MLNMESHKRKTTEEEMALTGSHRIEDEGKSVDDGNEGYADLGTIEALEGLDDIIGDGDDSDEEEFGIKHELLVGYLDDAKVVEENDLTANVRKQYTSANVSFF